MIEFVKIEYRNACCLQHRYFNDAMKACVPCDAGQVRLLEPMLSISHNSVPIRSIRRFSARCVSTARQVIDTTRRLYFPSLVRKNQARIATTRCRGVSGAVSAIARRRSRQAARRVRQASSRTPRKSERRMIVMIYIIDDLTVFDLGWFVACRSDGSSCTPCPVRTQPLPIHVSQIFICCMPPQAGRVRAFGSKCLVRPTAVF